MPSPPPHYELPSSEALPIGLPPRKASWDAASARSQIELGRYLDHVESIASGRLAELEGPLALRLDVGLAAGVDPLHENDLDSFLEPVVRRLGPHRFVSVWATKRPGGASYLRIEPAEATSPEHGWQEWTGRTTGSTVSRAWKEQVKAAVIDAKPLPPGPVALQISFRVDPRRAWVNLWKPAIDALDPILGRTFPDRPYHPRDGRVVRLGLHVAIDHTVGWDVPFCIRARPASLSWPEMSWFAAMSSDRRAEWLKDHESRLARYVRGRPASPQKPADLPRRRDLQPAPRATSYGAVEELTSLEAFRATVLANEPVVITNVAQPAKLHLNPAQCAWVKESYFIKTVIKSRRVNGGYYAAASEQAARARWPQLTKCRSCSGLDS